MSDTTGTSEPISDGDLVDQELPDAGEATESATQADEPGAEAGDGEAEADEAAGSVESDTAGEAGE